MSSGASSSSSPLEPADLRRATALRRRRMRLGLSQSALAEHLGVRPSTIFRWERGDRRCPSHIDRAMRDLELELGPRSSKAKG